ncbi:hypothetical protein ZWY2020_017228 [Hordeum vulgare]|nr:hypothetical protein ZWY2020_017228 [Hordeum vulgare]
MAIVVSGSVCRMRLQGPRCSFREGDADMAGAIFMSNSETRDHCFNTGVFGLPPEYGPFVANVKQGMPLFLFDYTFRKLYGVFEAASDGGMDISRTAFRSTGRTYPAQVCFNIVWKCRPLNEDEFFPAIEENYYISKKFYFDLSYQQVVRLYGLFDKKRVPTGDERSYLTSTLNFPSYHDSSSPQRNSHWKDDYDINCDQCKEMYAFGNLHLNRRKSVTPPDSTQLAMPPYPEAPEVSAMVQHKESFTGYIPIHDRPEDLEKEQQRCDFNRDGSASSGSGHETLAYISDRPYTDHDVGGESNMAVPSQRPQKNVFSRLSVKPQLPSQEITGPSINQLLYLLSQRTKQWSNKSTSPREDGYKQLVREQGMDMPCPPAELNLPSGLEVEESADPPFLNFKRRSKAAGLDTDVGKEVSGKKKRRKLVRPSFGENNTTESDMVEDGNIAPCPAATNIQTENPREVDVKKQNCSNSTAVISKQDVPSDSGTPTEKITLDLNITDLNTMDEAKLQAILGSSLLQALDKLRNSKSNDSNNAKSSPFEKNKNSEVKMEMKSDTSAKHRCN